MFQYLCLCLLTVLHTVLLPQNPADSVEVIEKRITEYNMYAEDMADYYPTAQHVNADQDPYTVHECIESVIVNPIPKQSLLLDD